MNRLRFEHEWVTLGGSGQREVDCTFARAAILLDDKPLARVFDRRANSTSDHLLVPLYPLAEWIAARWWSLLEEAWVPGVSDAYLSRHSLKYVGDGFAYPDVRIAPQGEDVRVQYEPLYTRFQNVDFVGQPSDVVVSRDEVVNLLADIVAVTRTRLDSSGIANTWLQAEWDAIVTVAADEREFCTAAGWLGLDPFDLDSDAGATIALAWDRLRPDLREETLRAAGPAKLAETVEWISMTAEHALTAAGSGSSGSGWAAMRDRLPRWLGADPIRDGQLLARAVRRELGREKQPQVNLEQASPIPIFDAQRQPPVGSIDAVVAWAGSGPCCYTPRRAATSKRFAQARGLFEYFTSSEPISARLLSTVRTTHQQTGRVFAAELLAPIDLIREQVTGPEVTPEDVNEIASVFNVSPQVISKQIENNRLASIARA